MAHRTFDSWMWKYIVLTLTSEEYEILPMQNGAAARLDHG